VSIRRKLAASAVTGAFLFVGLAAAIPAASAAEGDGNCVSNDAGAGGDLCLYYNHGFAGARFNDPHTDNYAGWAFVAWSGGNAGAGQGVKNNAASVQNWDTGVTGDVYYNSNQQGARQQFAPFTAGDLNSTLKNQNASQGWF
jgi:hypothetical protein